MDTNTPQAPQTEEDVLLALLFEIFGDELTRPGDDLAMPPTATEDEYITDMVRHLDALDAAIATVERCPEPPTTTEAANGQA